MTLSLGKPWMHVNEESKAGLFLTLPCCLILNGNKQNRTSGKTADFILNQTVLPKGKNWQILSFF